MSRVSNMFAGSVTLLGVVALSVASPAATFDDPRLAQLAREVHNKGWIVYSGRTATGDWDVFVMRPDGSTRRNITNTPDSNEMIAGISLDGKRILYRRTAKTSKMSSVLWGTLGELVIANSDGSSPFVFGKDGECPWPSWSPDGKQIACVTKGGIEIWDVATKTLVRKMDRKGIYQQLVWSPDGKWLTGPANHQGEQWTVVRLNVVTDEVNRVSKFTSCTPDWFPDSAHLIYSSRPSHQEEVDGGRLSQAVGQKLGYGWTQLWMADAEGKSNNLVYGEDGRHIYGGAISPDSKYVLFTRSPIDEMGMNRLGAPISLMRLRDAPTIAGESKALRKLHPDAKNGAVLSLPDGWEPCWTFAQIVR
jgi:Tol biopolymer transport system component